MDPPPRRGMKWSSHEGANVISHPQTAPFTQREVFDLQLERVRLKAMLLLAVPTGTDPPRPSGDAQRHKLEADLAEVEGRLAEVRRAGLQVAFRHVRLADALGLAQEDLDLLWAAVAVSCDPRI